MLEFDLPRSRKEKLMIPIDGGKNWAFKTPNNLVHKIWIVRETSQFFGYKSQTFPWFSLHAKPFLPMGDAHACNEHGRRPCSLHIHYWRLSIVLCKTEILLHRSMKVQFFFHRRRNSADVAFFRTPPICDFIAGNFFPCNLRRNKLSF